MTNARYPGTVPSVYALLGVLLVTGLTFSPVLFAEFPYDDGHVVRAVYAGGVPNPMVAELQPLTAYFCTEYWSGTGADTLHANPLYRPVTVYSFALTHALWPGSGDLPSEAFPHHLLNLLLHLLNTVLVFSLARVFSARPERRAGPLVAAALFGLLGVHAEAVAAIVGRADLFAFAFGALAALSVFAIGPNGSARARLGWGALASASMFLAFCSKESALAWWPFLVVAALVRGDRIVTPLACGVIPVVLWWFLRAQAFVDLPAAEPVAFVSNPLRDVELPQRLFAGVALQGMAFLKCVSPVGLCSDYGASVLPFTLPGGGGLGLGVAYCAVLAALIGMLFVARRLALHRPTIVHAVVAFLGFGFVTSNLAVVIGTTWAERLVYLPSLAVSLLGLAVVERRGSVSRWVAIAFVVYMVFHACQAFTRCREWRDNATLFRADVVNSPRSLAVGFQAALVAKRASDRAGYRHEIERLIRVEPRWARPRVDLGAQILADAAHTGPPDPQRFAAHLAARCAEAEGILRGALRPDAIIEPRERVMCWHTLGLAILHQKRLQEAWSWFERILRHHPQDVRARHNILVATFDQIEEEAFKAVLRAGEAVRPEAPIWQVHRGLLAARRGEWREVRQRLETVLPRLPPSWFDQKVQSAWLALADARHRTGAPELARQLWQRIAGDARFVQVFRKAAAAQLR